MTNTTTKKSSSKKYLVLGGIAAAVTAVGLILSVVAGTTFSISSIAQAQGQEEGQEQGQGQQASTTVVAAGGGGPESVLIAYEPQNVTISAGQTVVWTNPTVVGEPHTVSFIRQPDLFAAIESPFSIPSGTQLTPANPNERNTEPFIIPGQNDTAGDTIVAANKRASLPAVMDAQNNVEYLPPNASYTMTGDELYVNSGWLWPEGQIPPGLPPITSFSVTFENAGTYDYLCVIHPWMAGQVVVE